MRRLRWYRTMARFPEKFLVELLAIFGDTRMEKTREQIWGYALEEDFVMVSQNADCECPIQTGLFGLGDRLSKAAPDLQCCRPNIGGSRQVAFRCDKQCPWPDDFLHDR